MNSRILAAACAAVCIAGTAHAINTANTKPLYGNWGFDLANMDKSIKPGDDFFRYANGAWIDKTEIPADKSAVSLRLAMSDMTEQRLHGMMEDAAAHATHEPTTLDGKVGAFYKSFMDTARVDALGSKAIAPELDTVRNATSRDELAALMGRDDSDFEGTLFNLYFDVDLKNPKRYAVYISQGGLGLPDRDYYLKPEFATQKAAYTTYLAKLLALEGWKDSDAAAKDVVTFETKIADVSWSKVEQRDPVATYNPMSIDELQKLAPDFAWTGFLKEARLGNLQRIVVAEKTALPKLAALYAATPIDT
ncbi:MAG: M13 family metallopeptidase N-terminal domain-containing protein, partial [Lysobacteraceae bacterium]